MILAQGVPEVIELVPQIGGKADHSVSSELVLFFAFARKIDSGDSG